MVVMMMVAPVMMVVVMVMPVMASHRGHRAHRGGRRNGVGPVCRQRETESQEQEQGGEELLHDRFVPSTQREVKRPLPRLQTACRAFMNIEIGNPPGRYEDDLAMPEEKPRKRSALQTMVLAPVILLPCLFVAWLLYSSSQVQNRYREGERFTAGMRRVEKDFRTYFHGKGEYPALTLPQMESSGILSGESAAFIAAHGGYYTPFSPATPPDAVTLTIKENLFSSWDLTKDELTRAPKTDGTAAALP